MTKQRMEEIEKGLQASIAELIAELETIQVSSACPCVSATPRMRYSNTLGLVFSRVSQAWAPAFAFVLLLLFSMPYVMSTHTIYIFSVALLSDN